jgi:hypothetical protein
MIPFCGLASVKFTGSFIEGASYLVNSLSRYNIRVKIGCLNLGKRKAIEYEEMKVVDGSPKSTSRKAAQHIEAIEKIGLL